MASSLKVLNDETPRSETRSTPVDTAGAFSSEGGLWKSPAERTGGDAVADAKAREFKQPLFDWQEATTVDRRRFLQLSGASLALAGLTGCTRQPSEKLVPYVEQPEEVVPGKPLFYATATSFGGYAQPLLAESHMGRPTKVEGNPEHPASRGATDLFAQASVLELYDPDRAQSIRNVGAIQSWSDVARDVGGLLSALETNGGDGLRFLTQPITSPSVASLLGDVLERFPNARWHVWDAASGAADPAVEAIYSLADTDVVLALDADFLTSGPGQLLYARDFADRRRLTGTNVRPARLYAVESGFTNTGAMADHRMGLKPSELAAFAAALASELGAAPRPGRVSWSHPDVALWVREVAKDLRAASGRAVVIAGEQAPEDVQVLARAMNQALGAVGGAVRYRRALAAQPDSVAAGGAARRRPSADLAAATTTLDPADELVPEGLVEPAPGSAADEGAPLNVDETVVAPLPEGARNDVAPAARSLVELADALRADQVHTLVILGGNPVFDAPPELGFAAALDRAPQRMYMGLYENETSERCQWMVPQSHALESWSDGLAYDGTVTFGQPILEPLHESRTPAELLALFAGREDVDSYDLLTEFWEERGVAGEDFRRAIHDGMLADAPGIAPAAGAAGAAGDAGAAARRIAETASAASTDTGTFELSLRPDPTLWDGHWANIGWLQECPKPLTKLTWDNALLMAPADAQALEIETEDVVRLTAPPEAGVTGVVGAGGGADERSVEVPVFVLPGQPQGSLTLHVGYGRRRVGAVGAGHGVDAYPMRSARGLWTVTGVRLEATGEKHALATTQDHFSMDGRGQVRTATLEHFQEHPDFAQHWGHSHEPDPGITMYPAYEYDGYAWGLAVDLNACTGCNACVVACQSENNIPVVGKDQVLNGREMHWIRIDRYFEGSLDAPSAHHQPVMCQHCERAPCEVVCPVAATVHSDEGLNDMVYNRCVGTRYCSNNCPYKVRRFNFLYYNDVETPLLKLMRNPDVTVRERGVMEKCTYCVQRINWARQTAKVERRSIRDGEVRTACQQVCPSAAISFGDINDPEAEVTQWKDRPTDYGLLAELNVRPRTSYLAKVKNFNPALERA